MDIAHTIQLGVEKKMGSKSHGGVVQGDIERYYDSINVIRSCRRLIEAGVHPGHVAASCRLQSLPQVQLKVMSQHCTIVARTLGTLTGSRTAGILGRVPIEDVCRKHSTSLRRLGFSAGARVISLMSWIDNLYLLGPSVCNAMEAMKLIEESLRNDWGLHIKADSKLILQIRGSDENLGKLFNALTIMRLFLKIYHLKVKTSKHLFISFFK